MDTNNNTEVCQEFKDLVFEATRNHYSFNSTLSEILNDIISWSQGTGVSKHLEKLYRIQQKYPLNNYYKLTDYHIKKIVKYYEEYPKPMTQCGQAALEMMKLVIKNESAPYHDLIPENIKQRPEIAILLETMSLIDKIDAFSLNNQAHKEINNYRTIIEILDPEQKGNFMEGFLIRINRRKDDENFDDWWENMAIILPEIMITQIKEQVPEIKALIDAPKEILSDEEMADNEAIIFNKAGFTGALPLYKLIDGNFLLDKDGIKTLEFYRELCLGDFEMQNIIDKLQSKDKLSEEEKAGYKNYALQKSRTGDYIARVNENDMVKLFLKNPDLEQIIMELKNNYSSLEGQDNWKNVYKTYLDTKEYMLKNPLLAEAYNELIAQRNFYETLVTNTIPDSLENDVSGLGVSFE